MENVFLSCDWGTSNFRLRLIDTVSLGIIRESYSNEGVAGVFQNWQHATTDRIYFYRSVIQNHIAAIEASLLVSLAQVPVVVSGMASATIGIKELPYKEVPFAAWGNDLYFELIEGTPQFPHPMMLVSGARTENDVMRGEETQLAGCMPDTNKKDGVFVFPGTHSKHIYVQEGIVTHFETYMTGEFFNLLSGNSILANSVVPGTSIMDTTNKAAFAQGVLDSQSRHLLHAVFRVRTHHLFQRIGKEQNFWYLSGLLIGAELGVLREKNTEAITVVGQNEMVQLYQQACATLRLEASTADGEKALVRAHAMLYKKAWM